MKHKTPPRRKARPVSTIAAAPSGDSDSAPIVERPDGYYWQTPDGEAEFGPFESYEEARADRDAAAVGEPLEDGETLREAEREIGINEWMDVETGEPAEGQSPPHLEEE